MVDHGFQRRAQVFADVLAQGVAAFPCDSGASAMGNGNAHAAGADGIAQGLKFKVQRRRRNTKAPRPPPKADQAPIKQDLKQPNYIGLTLVTT